MRTIYKASLLFFFLSQFAQAAPKQLATPDLAQMEAQIYKSVAPMNHEDETSVIVFFKYNCPVCRNYHSILDHWGYSLPKQFTFQFFPVAEGDGSRAVSNDSGLGLLGFWSSEKSGARIQRNIFSEEMYSIYQDRHQKISPDVVIEAAATSGLIMTKFELAWREGLSNGALHLDRQLYYKPAVTPSMVICGKYMISPENAMGNQDMFLQLANGLVSKCMVEKGLAK